MHVRAGDEAIAALRAMGDDAANFLNGLKDRWDEGDFLLKEMQAFFDIAATSDRTLESVTVVGSAAFGIGLGAALGLTLGGGAIAVGFGLVAGYAAEILYREAIKSAKTLGSWIGIGLYDWMHPDPGAISSTILSNPDPLVKDIKYVMVDPLVLDLDGDGLEITPLSQGVQFDGNGDTIRTNTSWIDADDGLLALDRNGNGVIDSGRELFGDETLLADGKKAAHGFAALAELDVGGAANATGGAGDGVFDAKDAQYANVRIWRDLNQDGISQAGEMQTLAEAGIASIKLDSTKTSTSYGDAQLVQSGSFTRTDGSEGQAGSFILAQNNAVTALNPQLRICSHRRKRRGCAGCGERQEIWGRLLGHARAHAGQPARLRRRGREILRGREFFEFPRFNSLTVVIFLHYEP
jgi:hypothetical protein